MTTHINSEIIARISSAVTDKTILITGANGFVGKNLLALLTQFCDLRLLCPTSKELNLLDLGGILAYMKSNRPDIVLHLAGMVGGIGANRERQADFFFRNALMGVNVYEAARISNVKKLVSLAAGCGYPTNATPPFQEEQFWGGLPDMNSYGYSMAKKNLVIQGWAYREQFDFDSTVLLPANLYGPYDNFDLHSSHVVPALVRKFSDAATQSKPNVTLWGTGRASREFLHARDLAIACILAIDIPEVGPFNVGTGVETTIEQLARQLKELTGFSGNLVWDIAYHRLPIERKAEA